MCVCVCVCVIVCVRVVLMISSKFSSGTTLSFLECLAKSSILAGEQIDGIQNTFVFASNGGTTILLCCKKYYLEQIWQKWLSCKNSVKKTL